MWLKHSFIIFSLSITADNDDDGETAAGGRLAHLLQILVSDCCFAFALSRVRSVTMNIHDLQEVSNVLVIVTRYFGGILLGPDRFKHINQAARNALEVGGFLDAPEVQSRPANRKSSAKARKR